MQSVTFLYRPINLKQNQYEHSLVYIELINFA